MAHVNVVLEWVGIVLATLMILLLTVAVPLSLRRNRKSIDHFDQTELDELHICVPDYRLKGVAKKLSQMGWDVVEAEQNAQSAGYSQVLLKRRDEADAASINKVLHKLNRMLLLPIGPLELKRLGEESA